MNTCVNNLWSFNNLAVATKEHPIHFNGFKKIIYFGKRGMTKSLSKGTIIMIVLLKPVHRVNDPYPLSV